MSDKIDVIIPCHNAEQTLDRAVASVINQEELGVVWLIDDASCDGTYQVMSQWQQAYPDKVRLERFAQNKGVAQARNVGAMLSKACHIAFLDADDAYQPQVLQACQMAFMHYQAGLIRLPMRPINMPSRFANHADFDKAWRTFEMTAGSNMVFNRSYFLALGGFDDADVFRRFGGEDGALGLASVATTSVLTLFDNDEFAVAVEYHCHEDMHLTHLMNAMLFGIDERGVSEHDVSLANQSTEHKIQTIATLKTILAQPAGKKPIKLS